MDFVAGYDEGLGLGIATVDAALNFERRGNAARLALRDQRPTDTEALCQLERFDEACDAFHRAGWCYARRGLLSACSHRLPPGRLGGSARKAGPAIDCLAAGMVEDALRALGLADVDPLVLYHRARCLKLLRFTQAQAVLEEMLESGACLIRDKDLRAYYGVGAPTRRSVWDAAAKPWLPFHEPPLWAPAISASSPTVRSPKPFKRTFLDSMARVKYNKDTELGVPGAVTHRMTNVGPPCTADTRWFVLTSSQSIDQSHS